MNNSGNENNVGIEGDKTNSSSDSATDIFPEGEMRQIAEMVSSKLRPHVDHDEDSPLDITAYQIRVAELTEQLMDTPQAVAISRLAYMDRIERVIRSKNTLETALLWLAEDLDVELTLTVTNVATQDIINNSVKVVHTGTYRIEQLAHIAVYCRQRIAKLKSGLEASTVGTNSINNELINLKKELENKQLALEELKKQPPPPQVSPNSIVLCYRDKKNRLNYLGQDANTCIRTRNIAKALRFPDVAAAGNFLLDFLNNIRSHAFPTGYRLEIHSLHLINQSLASLDRDLQNKLIEAKTIAVKYEAEFKDASKVGRKKNKRIKGR
jgi:hypothetical protein